MSKIYIKNETGSSVTVTYESEDNQRVSQTIGSNSLKQTEKKVKSFSRITISAGEQNKSIDYEPRDRNNQLRVTKNLAGVIILQWI
ncbi:hypothetical protein FBALC1_08803 [Flavobacteriales bacterium ALC-1]|nr:hypothetical protein FBALC1_08803 [Flavobacteriales bacterium ALC-1]